MRNVSQPSFEDFDEHDSPTEPMAAIILSPAAVPSPLPPAIPFPHNGHSALPTQYAAAPPGVYPVLPPSPVGQSSRRPPGGAGVSGDEARPLHAQPGRSSFPTLVGALFVAAQLILLARVVLLLFGVAANNLLVELVYAGGAVFAWPLRLLLEHLPLPAQIGGDLVNYLAALLAILIYGVLARVLVRFLKAFLNSR